MPEKEVTRLVESVQIENRGHVGDLWPCENGHDGECSCGKWSASCVDDFDEIIASWRLHVDIATGRAEGSL